MIVIMIIIIIWFVASRSIRQRPLRGLDESFNMGWDVSERVRGGCECECMLIGFFVYSDLLPCSLQSEKAIAIAIAHKDQ